MASRVQIGHTMITENGIKKVTNIENIFMDQDKFIHLQQSDIVWNNLIEKR